MLSDIASGSLAGARAKVNSARSFLAIEKSPYAHVNVHVAPRDRIARGRHGNRSQGRRWNGIEAWKVGETVIIYGRQDFF